MHVPRGDVRRIAEREVESFSSPRFPPGAVTEFDIEPDAWYFEANGSPMLPYMVLLEASIQPGQDVAR